MARRKRSTRTRRNDHGEDEKAPLPLSEAEVEDFHSKIQDRSDRWAEEYSEVVDQLPLELQRTFVLMKELDERAEALKENVHETWKQYCSARDEDASAEDAEASSSRTSLLRSIRDQTQQDVSLSEEKLALAISAYDVVDRQIRRLDTDLLKNEKSLCARLRKDMTDALDPSSSSHSVHAPVPKDTDRFSPEGQLLTFWSGLISLDPLTCLAYLREFLQADPSEPEVKKKKRKTSEKQEEAPSDPGAAGLIDYDPSEPRYCYCDRVSYGEFHYACVGLEQPPKGKWYCQLCAPPGWKGPGMKVPAQAPIRPDRTRTR